MLRTATPQDTYDHVFGSGALSYHWWLDTKTTGVDGETFKAADDWSVEVTAENGNDGEKTVTVDHKAIMRAANKVIEDPPKYASGSLSDQCKRLVFNADTADLDAAVADELLQVVVLGELVFC